MAIYVLLDETRSCCKIGYSKDRAGTECRIKSLQTASPFKLSVLAVNSALNRLDEQDLHSQLSEFLTGGGREWFDYTKEEVLQAVEYIKNATKSKFPSKELPKEIVEKQPNCECCECEDCESCNCDIDWRSGLCLNCLREQDEYFCGFTHQEFSEFIETATTEKWIPSDAVVAKSYIDKATNINHVALSISQLIDYLVDGNCKNRTSIAAAAMLGHKLTQPAFDDDHGEVFPALLKSENGIQVVYVGDFGVTMEQAESTYSDHFYDVDEYGSQLFVYCINKSREIKEVPYLFGLF